MLFSKREPVRLVSIFKATGKNDKPYARVKIGCPETFDTVEAFLSVPKGQNFEDFVNGLVEGQNYSASVNTDGQRVSLMLAKVNLKM